MPLLDSRPDVGIWIWYWRAFTDLTTCRMVGEDPGPIPWTAANEWARRYQLSDQEFAKLWIVVSAIDAVYLKCWRRKVKEALERGRSTRAVRKNHR